MVSDDTVVSFATGEDLTLTDLRAGSIVLRLQGEDDARWAVGRDALVLCRWKPEQPVEFYSRFTTKSTRTTWTLPEKVRAVAVSEMYIAVRVEDVTGVFHHDGTPVHHRRLPRWQEGFLLQDSLIVSSAEGPPRDPGVWVFHLLTLELVWSSSAETQWREGETGE